MEDVSRYGNDVCPSWERKKEIEAELSKKADDAEGKKMDEENGAPRAEVQDGEAIIQEGEYETWQKSTGGKTPFDTIADDGYRGGLDEITSGSRSIDEASFTKENIAIVQEHLTKDQISNNGKLWENNQVMIERLNAIERGELRSTNTDKAFITHELRESELMSQGKSYEEAHAQTCKKYSINTSAEKINPHPFYTPEVETAFNNAELKRMGY